jgi:hypothetical protein
MSRFGRRIWGVVLCVAAAHLFVQAATFRWDIHGKSDRAYYEWRKAPSPETEGAWATAIAERRESERKYRRGFATLGGAVVSAGLWLLLRKPQHPDYLSIAPPPTRAGLRERSQVE